jgi:hypothetical protein
VHSRQSINDARTVSLNSPEAPPANQGKNDDVPLLQIDAEPDNMRDSRLAAHSIGPIADLYCRYLHETDDGLSPSQRVSLLYGSLLQPSDIRDRGVNLQNPSLRFTLSSHKLTNVSNVVREVQEILDCLVVEIDHRLTGYKVDAGGKLREALAGADTVPQLEHAWSFLTNWVFEGGKHVDKYY